MRFCGYAKRKGIAAVLVMYVASIANAQAPAAASGAYRIAGTVVDAASGRPLARTEVSIDLIDGKNTHETYATGADGAFAFEGLTAGRYQLSAKRRGYVEQSYKRHEGYFTAIVVGPTTKSDDVRFAMTAGGSIVGHVMDEHGEPVREGRVLLLREVSTGRGRRLTRYFWTELDDLGAYRFDHLETGSYVVAVMAQPWYAGTDGRTAGAKPGALPPSDLDTDVVYPVTFYPGAMDAEAAGRIMLAAGENATADVSLAPVEARGQTVKISDNDPNAQLVYASIVQYIANGIAERLDVQTTFGKDNTVTFEGLPSGRVDLVWKTGEGKSADEHLKSLNSSGGETEASGAPTVIRGVLEGIGGVKVAGTTVKLMYGETGGKSFSATTGAKGEFEFSEELVSGLYSIAVPQIADAQMGIRLKGANFFGLWIEIQPGHDVELKILAGRAGRVRGRVVKSGAGAEGAFVALVPEGFEGANNLMRVGESDSDGAFELKDVVPGRYVVIAVEDGWSGDWKSAEWVGRFVTGGKKVEVGPGMVVDVETEATK